MKLYQRTDCCYQDLSGSVQRDRGEYGVLPAPEVGALEPVQVCKGEPIVDIVVCHAQTSKSRKTVFLLQVGVKLKKNDRINK